MWDAFLGPNALQNQLFALAALTELGGFGLVALGAHPGMFVGSTFAAFLIVIAKVALPVLGKIISERAALMPPDLRNPRWSEPTGRNRDSVA